MFAEFVVEPQDEAQRLQSATGTFLQRLNYIAGNRFNFDLPTELMWEIATRAGSTSTYYWGDTADEKYMVCGKNRSIATGQRLPNAWGLYDTIGNMYELCLDDCIAEKENLSSRPDPFTPSCSGVAKRATRGGSYAAAANNLYLAASARVTSEPAEDTTRRGLRVAMIID